MLSTDKRRWTFTLRGLLLAMTVVGGWLGYYVHWIRARREAHVWIDAHVSGDFPGLDGDDSERQRFPWPLALLGEAPLVDEAIALRPLETERYNPASYLSRIEEIRRLFPETEFVDFGDGSVYWPE